MQLAVPLANHKAVRALRAQAAILERYRGFDRCMRKLDVGQDQPVPVEAVTELYAHWGDPLSRGAESYVRSALGEAFKVEGPIVQCGSSMLTLALGLLCHNAERPDKQLWCLEHETHWANTVRSWLTQYRISSAHIITSRAHLFDGDVW
jgi:hypothetical protein